MRRRVRLPLVLLVLLFPLALTIHAGGPPIVTIERLPEYFVVGEPVAMKFVVLSYCCNQVPLENTYAVRAHAEGLPAVNFPAIPTKISGEYLSTLTLPRPGKWTLTVQTVAVPTLPNSPGYVFAATLPIDAVPRGAPAPKRLSRGALGERLFAEKGCMSCHVIWDIATPAVPRFWQFGAFKGNPPDLTAKRFPADYLRSFLANPAAARKGAQMPRLRLTAGDVEALVALINRDRSAAE